MTDARATERGPTSLASKNPFRNLVSSDNKTVRPISTNPFLDSNEVASPERATKATPTSTTESATGQSSVADKNADLFVSQLKLQETGCTDAIPGKSQCK